jgi:uncharacterized protein (DUF608 family)
MRLRAFAPLIPHDYDNSSLPVALFHFQIANPAGHDTPVELRLQWEPAHARGTKEARGNVEGTLAWRKQALAPGEKWRITPTLAFSESKGALLSAIDTASPGEPLAGVDAPEGRAFASGTLSDVFLDSFGGFNWEQHHRQGAVFGGVANVSQIMWELRYDGKRVGRGPNKGWGLQGDGLPAKTEDGSLRVRMQPRAAGANGIAFDFEIENVSAMSVEHLQFGMAVNADLGGIQGYEHNGAHFEDALGGIVFESEASVAAALLGKADAYSVSAWPRAHEALFADELQAVKAGRPDLTSNTETFANGVVWRGDMGSYALMAQGDGWTAEPGAEPGLVRVTARRSLGRGVASDVWFALAWYFPEWMSSDGELLRHRYASKFGDAADVARAAMARAGDIERRIVKWQETIYTSPVPLPLQDALINSLYVLPRNSWWLADGRFFQSESFTGCPITETFVCRFNGSFPLALMWPDCERATLSEVKKFQIPSGQVPFSFGGPTGVKTPNFDLQKPIVSTEYVLTCWRNFALWHNDQYLRETYDSMKKAMDFAFTLDTDGDGLVNEAPGSAEGFPANQYYDVWPWWGTSAYTGSICLAAIHAMEQAATAVSDHAYAARMREVGEKASRTFDDLLWTGAYYRLYNDPVGKRRSDTVLTNALCGQWFAYACGLGDILPRDRVLKHIDTVLRLNAKASPYGAVNGVKPDGSIDQTFAGHSAVITIGEVWNFCAMAMHAGRGDEAIALFNSSYENVALRQKSPWNIPWCYNHQTGRIQWGINYYSNPCVWTLLDALSAETYTMLAKPGA